MILLEISDVHRIFWSKGPLVYGSGVVNIKQYELIINFTQYKKVVKKITFI